MAKHTLPFLDVDKGTYDLIKSGEKNVEVRGGGPKYEHVVTGDTIEFTCGKDRVERKVKNLHHFKNIDDMLKVFSVQYIDPSASTKEDLQKMYDSFPNYKERLAKYGLLVFELNE